MSRPRLVQVGPGGQWINPDLVWSITDNTQPETQGYICYVSCAGGGGSTCYVSPHEAARLLGFDMEDCGDE